ncbi:putative nuclease HARBI1 [Plutella xylostella]|uniref:putative nuclease HARBI1 n=1 Tax=Plutella xylostella TaxID=51655 RepID=UPI002032A7AC|nr:putative nuclease HARBI1 [Plutella xylostella]
MEDFEEFVEFINYVYNDPYDYPALRYLRDASNPMECYDDVEFQQRFRFRKDTMVNTILPLTGILANENSRGLPISPIINVLVAMRFYATGNFQIDCGDRHKLSQAVACKIIARVSRALALHVGQYVKFPPVNELAANKRKMFQIAGFPGAIGAIDCTHISIKNPDRERGEVFRNRKGNFSINVQLVCGPQMEIYDVVARWPGSVHDSRIFANSRCYMMFEEGTISGILLGDSGYAQTSYMYTPVINPRTQPEERYNRAHISTRNIIERVNGVLKRRFACLSRTLQNRLHNIPNIIVACVVLHNISITTNQELPAELIMAEEIPVAVIPDNERGSLIRAAFIGRHFT